MSGRWAWRTILGLCLAASAAWAAEEADNGADKEDSAGALLSQDGYWRVFLVRGPYRFDPKVLKEEAEKWQITDRILKGMEKETMTALAAQPPDWSKTDWKDVACFFESTGGPTDLVMGMQDRTPPPADWAKPEFDDACWTRTRFVRYPFFREQGPDGDVFNWNVYLRSYFEIPDPAQAGDLVLNLTYRGGVRIVVNGQEIARGHLPAGDLSPYATSESYPEDAYRCRVSEVPDPNKGERLVPDLRFPFLRNPRSKDAKLAKFRHTGGTKEFWLSREGWERITALRDRTLGPVKIPASALRKGRNVLAIEIRGSYYHPVVYGGVGGNRFFTRTWNAAQGNNYQWAHARLIGLKLEDPSGKAPSSHAPAQGFAVWAEDVHTRLYSSDYLQKAEGQGKLRMTGALNGRLSALVVVRAEQAVQGLKASAGKLVHEDGQAELGATVEVRGMVPHDLTHLTRLGLERGFERDPVVPPTVHAIHYASRNPDLWKPYKEGPSMREEAAAIDFFDHIGSKVPAEVSAGKLQPLWVSLKVPGQAKPGVYKGTFRVEAQGVQAHELPMAVEVEGWRIPNPDEFQTAVTLEPSPYGVANQYLLPKDAKVKPNERGWEGPVKAGAALWSDAHFAYLEKSFELLGRVGNDLLYVPVLQRTEFGNWEDSMIKWIRKKDGRLAFDFSIMDRYVDLYVKHCGKPRAISFLIMHFMRASPKPVVSVLDEASGKTELLSVGWMDDAFERLPVWKTFAQHLMEHMKTKGLERSVYWGHAGDHESDPALIDLMWNLYPENYWTASGHSFHGGAGGGGHSRFIFRSMTAIYGEYVEKETLREGQRGWKVPDRTFLYTNSPRDYGGGVAQPLMWRNWPMAVVHRGWNGVGRCGFDGWNYNWYSGYVGKDWLPPGRPCHQLAWPGPDGAESSARFEILTEGIQECEAKIFLEQCIDRKLLAPELAAEAQQAVLDRMSLGAMLPNFQGIAAVDYAGPWQDGSRRFFRTAAKVAEAVGVDLDRVDMKTRVAALGRAEESVLIRNWTGASRAWTAQASAPWIKLAQSGGDLLGFGQLKFTLDGASLKPGETLTGEIAVVDQATSKKHVLKVVAEVGDPVELRFEHPHFNATVGESDVNRFRLVNQSVAPQDWALAASVPWIKAEPASGHLEPGKEVYVTLTATPPDKEQNLHENKLLFKAAGGVVNKEVPSRTFVIPAYQKPEKVPFGKIVKLEEMDRKRVKGYVECAKGTPLPVLDSMAFKPKTKKSPVPTFGRTFNNEIILLIGKERYSRGMWVNPQAEATYNLEGSGITGFSAYVGITEDARKLWIRQHQRRVNFEIHVDGKVVCQSGMMTTRDPARLLVIEGLADAKEFKLVTRLDSDADNEHFLSTWADANFYQKRDKDDQADAGK